MRRLLLAAALAWVPARLMADAPGTTGAEVLKFGAGPRAFAMGGAQTALTNDSFSLNLNPGGLGFVEYQEASFVYNNWVEGVADQTLLYARPDARLGTFGVGLTRFSVGGFQGYDASGLKAGTVRAQDTVFQAGYGKRFDAVGFGAGLKWIREDLEKASASTYALDVGLQSHHQLGSTMLGAGLAVQNIGPGLKFDRETARLPTSVRLGVSGTRALYGDPCSLALDVGRTKGDDRLQIAVGAEAGVMGVLAFRAGYQAPLDQGSGLSFGLGMKAKNVRFDYAFLLLGEFGPTHRFGLTFRWGEPQEVSRDRDRVAQAAGHKQRAREYVRQGRYLDALEQYNLAIDLDPLDKETVLEMRKAFDALPH